MTDTGGIADGQFMLTLTTPGFTQHSSHFAQVSSRKESEKPQTNPSIGGVYLTERP
jgi:hypothetical protein